MNNFLFAAVGASLLFAAGVASAQGLPPETVEPVYGSAWTTHQLSLRSPDANEPSTGQANAAQASDRMAARNAHVASPAVHGS